MRRWRFASVVLLAIGEPGFTRCRSDFKMGVSGMRSTKSTIFNMYESYIICKCTSKSQTVFSLSVQFCQHRIQEQRDTTIRNIPY